MFPLLFQLKAFNTSCDFVFVFFFNLNEEFTTFSKQTLRGGKKKKLLIYKNLSKTLWTCIFHEFPIWKICISHDVFLLALGIDGFS